MARTYGPHCLPAGTQPRRVPIRDWHSTPATARLRLLVPANPGHSQRPRTVSRAGCTTGSDGDDLDAVGLGTLGALDDLELHPLVLVEGPVAVGLDRRVVDEDVLTVVHGDEAVALLVVEPLHG